MPNHTLGAAKRAKNDEFYTQYQDIEKEISAYLDYDQNAFRDKTVLLPCDDPDWSNFTRYFAQNFQRLGLKKLIGTSYAEASKPYPTGREIPDWEKASPKFDPEKALRNGKIFVVDSDRTGNGRVDYADMDWDYLEGDGDFRSEEVKRLRDEADIVVTNPPFSLFRDFWGWINEKPKKFLIIGNMNALTYKEVFPKVKDNATWFGPTISSGDREFEVPQTYPLEAAGYRVTPDGRKFIRVKGVRWFTNLDHGRRHEPLSLMTEAEVVRYGSGQPFQKYDNYDAIEVPKTKWIPSDYKGVMGVPISFLDKYCPEQFEIVGITKKVGFHLRTKIYPDQIQVDKSGRMSTVSKLNDGAVLKLSSPPVGETYYMVGGESYAQCYARVLIRHKNPL